MGFHLEIEPLASEWLCNWTSLYKEERNAEQETNNEKGQMVLWCFSEWKETRWQIASLVAHFCAVWQVSLVTCHPFCFFHFMLHSLISFPILKNIRVVSYTVFQMPLQIQLQFYFVIWYVSGIETIKKIDFDHNLNCHLQFLTEVGVRKGVSHSRLLTLQNALECASKWWIPCWLQIKQYIVFAE